MARQISLSDDVYEELSRRKGGKSFSEYIREKIGIDSNNAKFWKLAGLLKGDAKKLNELQKIISKERASNRGRKFGW
ncbi:MAG: antitoxin [Candidatus Micrarchaeota archaeon]|nr:antitoxin [Candidatus Micrarchaeota archaeon]MDE1834497.1 antitoxin [Candidatus Micrarchaeota archaeon]MDE1859951.1 antitoxin [Candidatus Micrarchaeota archaeon]